MKQDIIFQNSKEDHLQGILVDPSGDPSRLMVIMVHGFSSSKDTPHFVAISDFLNDHGISTFRFDIYGHGESDGLLEDVTLTEAVDDAKHAIEYIADKGYTNIGLLGSSFGGLTSVIAASQTPDLRFLVLKSPVSTYDGIKRETKINEAFYKDASQNVGYDVAPKINVPTLIVHGDCDEVVPVAQSTKISKLISDCTLVIVKGADHRYTQPKHRDQMIDTIEKFIRDHQQ